VLARVIAYLPWSGGTLCEGNRAQGAGRSPALRFEAKEVVPLDCKRVSPGGANPV